MILYLKWYYTVLWILLMYIKYATYTLPFLYLPHQLLDISFICVRHKI
jgi:hypothetical protein